MKADRESTLRMLKTARGQLDGLIRMVEEDRYYVDISNQLLATQAILRGVNREVLRAHLNACVKESFENDGGQEKLDEIMSIIEKLSR